MKKFILNLLTVFAWIYQIFCVIGIIMGIVMIGVMPFGLKNPDFRAGFESGRGIKGGSVDSYIGAIVVHDERCSFFDLSICQINC